MSFFENFVCSVETVRGGGVVTGLLSALMYFHLISMSSLSKRKNPNQINRLFKIRINSALKP